MRSLKYIALSVSTLLAANLTAQDVHFSQFNLSPLTLNPALTGGYEGTFRVGGIYRDQWASVVQAAKFTTPSAYIDAPLVRGFGKNDWVGAGAVFLSDKSGSAQLTNQTALLSLAYHLGLGKKGNSTLAFGVQGGIVQKKFDRTLLLGEDGILQGKTVGTSDVFAQTNTSYPDFSAGLNFTSTLSSKVNFNIGASMAHLLTPRETFVSKTESNEKLARRVAVTAGANIDFGQKMVLMPSIMYLNQAKASQINVQSLLGYHLNAARDITALAGLGYRATNADAIFPMVGMLYKGLKVGVAYDINAAGLNQYSGGNGGYEIGVSYIARISRIPVVKPVLFCPRF